MRFQPRLGRYFAASVDNIVSIFDVETQARLHSLQVSLYLKLCHLPKICHMLLFIDVHYSSVFYI